MDAASRPRRNVGARLANAALIAALCLGLFGFAAENETDSVRDVMGSGLASYFPLPVLGGVLALLALSAFFSGSETAFFSINKVRLRAIGEEGTASGSLVARMMDHPGRFLTTILVTNTIVNVLISMFLGTRVQDVVVYVAPSLNKALAYVIAVVLTTAILVLFGEIAPKVFAVRAGEHMARITVFPLVVVDYLMAPLRIVLLGFTEAFFRITRFHAIHAAPFITDEEFKSALSEGEAQGVIEDDERQMIQGILEFGDALVREILVPRPDMIATPESATVGEALALVREHQYSRMPVYRDDLDHVTGLLLSKDLLPYVSRGELDGTIKDLVKPVHFVPATMTARQFVADARRRRAHLAVVVDEYGGTAGLITLEDAIEEVVGAIEDESDQDEPGYTKLNDNLYRVDGGLALQDFNALVGVNLEDEGHETLAGFLMDHIDKIPAPGDRIEHAGMIFTVEKCDGKRVESVRVHIKRPRGITDISAKTKAGAP